jgi:hypothetical protein
LCDDEAANHFVCKDGQFQGGLGCCTATATTGDDNNYNEEEEEEDDNGGEVVGGEGGAGVVQNQIRHCCHHWNKGGPHEGNGRQMVHCIDGHRGDHLRHNADNEIIALLSSETQHQWIDLHYRAHCVQSRSECTQGAANLGNSPSNNDWGRHSTMLGMGYIEEDGRV